MYRLWNNAIWAALFAMVIASLVIVFGPPLETRFAPVYSKFGVVLIEAMPDGRSLATFEFTRYRDCAPAGFSWYAGDPGAAFRQLEVIPAPHEDRPVVRPILGDAVVRSYVIGVDAQVLRDGVYAEIFSRCHPFWITRTVIYP